MLRVPILDNISRKGKVRNGLLKIYKNRLTTFIGHEPVLIHIFLLNPISYFLNTKGILKYLTENYSGLT